jgi:hypothetical protein
MTAAGKTAKVTLEGKGPATLRPADHIATGGEGSIYRLGNLAVKMYLDPLKMRQAGLPDKIKLLAKLAHPYIVGPRGLVLDQAGEAVGHYLPFVEKGHPLSLVFTNDFWSRESFDASKASALTLGMREVVEYAHQSNALLVDANELNWFALVDGKVEPRVIDVDSWAVGKWGASVIMPSIRDWNASTFNQETDWFAWGVVTFQIYTGIHPYKGTLAGFNRGDLVGRMKARASVFSPGIRLNAAVRDFASIPYALRSWYEAAFQKGERTKPPSPLDPAVSAAPEARTARMVTTTGGGALVYEKILATTYDPVVKVFFCGVALTRKGRLIDLASKQEIGRGSKDCEVVKTRRGWLVGAATGCIEHIDDRTLAPEALALHIECRRMFSYENRLFAVTERGLVEIKTNVFGDKVIASAGQTWGVMVNSTRWFEGVGVFDAIGAAYVVVPFGNQSLLTCRLPELDKLTVVAGKAGNCFAAFTAVDKNGQYQKIELTFTRDYSAPPKVWQGPADSADLNLAVLPKGVCATISKDGELDIFVPSAFVHTAAPMRRVEDSQIATDMALANWGDTVLFIQRGEVWTLKMR